MANSKRIYKDKGGNMFIPMNVEGGSWNEHFITNTKLVALIISASVAFLLLAWLKGNYASIKAYIIFMGMWLIGFSFVLRYIIFEENFYYKMYKKMQQFEFSTPAVFWDIASIKDTVDGAILTYADGKIGLIVKLERDTITGKNSDFREGHYDAISNFYKEITSRKYSYIQMNIMEQAGNDPRLVELDKLLAKDSNANICKLMEKQVGYIKNITNRTLYESDYILVYTKDLSRIDSMVNDTIESVYKILEGSFIGYSILRQRDIIEFIKEEYGVKYFNSVEATLTMFNSHGLSAQRAFKINEVTFDSGDVQKIGNKELSIINYMASEDLNNNSNKSKKSIKEAILTKSDKEKFEGIDFDSLADGIEIKEENEITAIEKIKKFTRKNKNDNSKVEENISIDNIDNFEVEEFGIHEQSTLENLEVINEGKIQQLDVNNDGEEQVIDFDDEIIDF